MFKYWETYTVYCYRSYDENELQKIAKDYKKYIENYKIYNGIEGKDTIDSFCDFIIGKEDFCFRDNYYYVFEDSNVEEFYNEIKKYL